MGKITNQPDLLSGMPLAQAVRDANLGGLADMLASALPGSDHDKTIHNMHLTQSMGESFTGGRSTPVYYLACQVQRRQVQRERHFCIKLIELPEDNHKRESYAVERRFYSVVGDCIRKQGLAIPKLLWSDTSGSKPTQAVCFLLTDVRDQHPLHPTTLNLLQATAALQWLARFHAVFWNDHSSWRERLWARGGFWTPGKDSTADGVAGQWIATVRWLDSKHSHVVTPSIKTLGTRIQRASAAICDHLDDQAKGPQSTLIHGDYKAANLFVNEAADSVAVVDFQYAGAGLGAEDVAYLLFPDALGDLLDDEDALLHAYHDELIEQLILQLKGGPSSLPCSVFRQQYGLARVDLARHWLSKGWVASTAGEVRLIQCLEATMSQLDGGEALATQDDYRQALQRWLESQ